MSLKTLLIMTCFGVAIAGLIGCVDLPTNQDDFPDFGSSTRIVNASGGTVEVLVERTSGAGLSSLGNVDDRAMIDYQNIPAGNRLFKLPADADTARIAVNSEEVATIVVLPRTDPSASRFQIYRERAAYSALQDTAKVRFIVAGTGTFDIVDMADSSVVATGGRGFTTNYVAIDFGTYSFGVAPTGTTNFLGSVNGVTAATGSRQTFIVFGTDAAAAMMSFADDVAVREIVN